MRLTNEEAADLTGYLEETNPRWQITLHSALNLGDRVEFDAWLRHVESIGHMRASFSLGSPGYTTGDYTQFDVRLAWRPIETIEMAVTGRNLGGAHQEFTQHEVEESIHFQVKIEFRE